jgi:adenosyl cobinamide kinase/adenosyl cobinamide phosphate guanylyltransferase
LERRWDEIQREDPLNKTRVATYRRLMKAEERISEARHKRGESWEKIEKALAGSELSDAELETEDDIYLASLTRFVTAMGGHVEVRAVFPEETITVRRDPEAGSEAGPEAGPKAPEPDP